MVAKNPDELAARDVTTLAVSGSAAGACHVIYSVRARTRDLSVVKLQFSGASDRLEWPARPYEVQAEWRNEGLTGTYLFELEAHPG